MEHQEDLARQIVEHARKARLGSTTMEEWRSGIEAAFIAQPETVAPVRVSDVRAMSGGAGSSSGTLFFTCSTGPEGDPLEYVLRFLPAEPLFHSYDLDGQVRIQRGLAATEVPVAKQTFEDIKGTHLGVPGYVMEKARGEPAAAAWFADGVIARASPERRRRLVASFFETLAVLHKVDWRRTGMSFLLDRAKGDGLISRESNWYWEGIEWACPQEKTRLQAIHAWLHANQPPYEHPVLCHGDANFTNALFGDDGVTALLDWEMSFIGTPECDVTYALIGMDALSPPPLAGVPAEAELIAIYESAYGAKLVHLDYYRLFALYRIVATHFLGLYSFPPEFQRVFAPHVEGLVTKLEAQARLVGV